MSAASRLRPFANSSRTFTMKMNWSSSGGVMLEPCRGLKWCWYQRWNTAVCVAGSPFEEGGTQASP